MKRILSIVLSVVLVITVIANILPSIISVKVSSEEVDTEIDLFNSNCYPAPTHVNPDIVTETDKGIWLGTDSNTWVSKNESNQDAPYMGANDVSGKILERNKAALTDIGDFEWQFQYRSDNAVKANASFVFHVNDNSVISSYASRKNVFAVTLYGSGYEESAANYYIPNSLNIEYPNAKGEMRPYKYDTSVSPWLTDPESYVKLDDTSAEKAIDLSKYFTVNIKMEGRVITVSAWQTENKAGTYREQSVNISNDTFFNNASSGDFAIISGADSGNYKIKDMTVSTPRLIDTVFDSSIYTNQINTAISDTALWFEEGWAGKKVNNVATRIFLNNENAKNNSSGKIFKRNKMANTDVDDFHWQFQINANRQTHVLSSFCFNVNENSDITDFASQKNLFSVTLYGSNYGIEINGETVSNALVVQQPNAETGLMETTGSYIKLNDSSAAIAVNTVNDTIVSIKLVGRKLTVAVWNVNNKSGTYRENVSELDEDSFAIAPSGDFAIIAGGIKTAANDTNIGFSNMTVTVNDTTPDVVVPEAEPDDTPIGNIYYRNDFSENTEGIVIKSKAREPEKTGLKTNSFGKELLQVTRESSKTNTRGGWSILHIDPENKYSDFALNMKVRLDPALNSDFSAVSDFMMINFHSGGNINKANILLIAAKGAAFAVSNNSDSENPKTYTNNRIAYAGNNSTDGKTFNLPTGKAEAGLSPDGYWHQISLVVKDGTYKYYMDGVLMIEVEDPEKLYNNGIIHINACREDLQIDYVEIVSADTAITPYEPEFEATPEPEPDPPPADGVYYSNDFSENLDGIVVKSKAREPEKDGLKTDKSGNQYLQVIRENSKTNTRGGWSVLHIDPENSYSDFTLNFKVKLDPELNSDFSPYNDFMLISFRSGGNIANANILQIAAKGAAFSVSDNTDSENPKTYTNNRIAYAGNNSTDNKTFKLPNGYAKAGLSADGVWHQISLVVDGWTYKYYMDGVLMMKVEDPEKLYKKGIIHINACREDLQIDDVKILTPDAVITPFEAEQLETGLVYANDFESEADLERINVTAGTYSIVADGDDSYFHIDYKPSESNAANGDAKIYFGPSGIKNFTLNFNVRITNNPNAYWHSVIPMGRINSGISVQARLFTKGSYLAVQDDTVINEVSRTGPADPNHKGKSPNPYHDKNYGISIIEWHKVSLVCDGWKYSLYLDGKKLLEGVDEYQLTKWGSFGIRTQGVSMDIDNIRVWGTPYYDLDYVEEVPKGTLYENDFEDESLDGIKFIYYDQEKTTVMTEENGNKFLRAYPNTAVKEDGKPVVTGNGNMLFSFGPPNAMDFELTFRLRMKSNTNENSGSAIVGIHSDPANIKWNTVWFNILARGTSVSLKDNSRKLGIDNLIASTGKNRSGGTQYQPSDNRAYGIRPDGRWHDIKVVVKGYTYTLYVDGNKYLTATDADETFYKGYTVIGSNNCKIDIDDIKLTNN